MGRINFNSLTTRLILLGMVFITLGGIARAFFLGNYLRKGVTEAASAQLLSMATYVAKNIDYNIVERREMLEHIAVRIPLSLLHNRKQLQKWLGERNDINPLFSQGIAVLGLSGVMLANYPATANRGDRSFSDRDYFQQALKGKFAIGRPVIGRISKVPVLPMAMPICDHAGKVCAVLLGVSALNSSNFLDSLYTTRVGTTGGLVLVSPRDKLFVGASDADIALKPTSEKDTYLQQGQVTKGFRGAGLNARRGIEELTAIASVPSSGWLVVSRLPTSEVYLPLTRLRPFILNNTAIIVPIFLLIMLFILRRVMRPLKNAAYHADRMTRGEIPFEPLPVVHNDEVGHLTAAFNRVLSKLIESRAELEHLSLHDTLTGLPNRQLLADRMTLSLARLQRNKGQIAVLFLDLNGFKKINDSLGHEAGDAALRAVADRLRVSMRSEDTLARVGGDEFVILIADLCDNAKMVAELVANKCLKVFQNSFIINDTPCQLGTSIGIAVGSSASSADMLLMAADKAMYRAKEAGDGTYYWA
ncbi:MAG: diguanylate cyclase [Desulfuromonadaceae bacterium]|nr:diguanylate cyclase [Desulfuromonadaceae bacterium]